MLCFTITDWEKTEWARLAQAADRQGLNAIGHRYSAAAAQPICARMSAPAYDGLQGFYRSWLVRCIRAGEVVAGGSLAGCQASVAALHGSCAVWGGMV